MTSLRRRVAQSDQFPYRALRALYLGARGISLPLPRRLARIYLSSYLVARNVIHFLRRVLIAEPLFKAYCYSCGRDVHTGIFVQWIQGSGRLVVGDGVRLWGKADIVFAHRFSDAPTLSIGDRTSIGHNVAITIGKRVTIGQDCHIAGGTRIFDSSGHPVDPAKRLQGLPPADDEVRPVVIGDNVWIGANAVIFPGVTVGEGSVISSNSVVVGDVPAYALMAGYPARRIRDLPGIGALHAASAS